MLSTQHKLQASVDSTAAVKVLSCKVQKQGHEGRVDGRGLRSSGLLVLIDPLKVRSTVNRANTVGQELDRGHMHSRPL